MAVQILVGEANGEATDDITQWVDFETISIEDTGNQTDDTASFEVIDKGLTIDVLHPHGPVRITQDDDDKFIGFIVNLEPAWEGISRRFRISCVGLSVLLDKSIIPATTTNTYRRAAGESDRRRILWLLRTFAQPFIDVGSSDFSRIQTLEGSMEAQDFQGLTVRQAIERVLGAASESSNYFVDTTGRLHTWDDDHEEDDEAPFAIVAEHTLASDEVAPSDLRVNHDTSELINYYFVRGKNAAGSGSYSDADSIEQYGRWQAFIDGPDSDTTRKAQRLGRAALRDTKDPIIRANFHVEDDYCVNDDGLTWKPGQLVSITSAAHDLDGYESRIVRTTTTYLNGRGSRRIEIEIGALRANFLGPDQWGQQGGFPNPRMSVDSGTVGSVARPRDTRPKLLDGFGRIATPSAPTHGDSVGAWQYARLNYGRHFGSWSGGLLPGIGDDFTIGAPWGPALTLTGHPQPVVANTAAQHHVHTICGGIGGWSGWDEQESWARITVGTLPEDAVGVYVTVGAGEYRGSGTAVDVLALTGGPPATPRQGAVVGRIEGTGTLEVLIAVAGPTDLWIGLVRGWPADYTPMDGPPGYLCTGGPWSPELGGGKMTDPSFGTRDFAIGASPTSPGPTGTPGGQGPWDWHVVGA